MAAAFSAVTPEPTINGQFRRATGGREIGGRSFTSRCFAGDDDTIRTKKFRGLDRFGETDVRGHGVRGMFLFHVGPHGDVFRANLFAIAQKRTRARIHPSFVGHMTEDKAFRTDEIESGGQGNGECGLVCSGQHLHAAGQIGGLVDRAAHGGHGRDDFGSDLAFEVGNVVHVLDKDRVAPSLGQSPDLLHGGADQFVD